MYLIEAQALANYVAWLIFRVIHAVRGRYNNSSLSFWIYNVCSSTYCLAYVRLYRNLLECIRDDVNVCEIRINRCE